MPAPTHNSGSQTVKEYYSKITANAKVLKYHDGNLFIGLQSGSLMVYNLARGKSAILPNPHGRMITAIEIDENSMLWTGSLEGTVNCWRVESQTSISHMYMLSYFQNNKIMSLSSAGGKVYVAAGRAGSFQIGQKLINPFYTQRYPKVDVIQVLCFNDTIWLLYSDGMIVIIDSLTRSNIRTVKFDNEKASTMCIMEISGKKYVAVGTGTGSLILAHENGNAERLFRVKPPEIKRAAISAICANHRYVAILMDGDIIVYPKAVFELKGQVRYRILKLETPMTSMELATLKDKTSVLFAITLKQILIYTEDYIDPGYDYNSRMHFSDDFSLGQDYKDEQGQQQQQQTVSQTLSPGQQQIRYPQSAISQNQGQQYTKVTGNINNSNAMSGKVINAKLNPQYNVGKNSIQPQNMDDIQYNSSPLRQGNNPSPQSYQRYDKMNNDRIIRGIQSSAMMPYGVENDKLNLVDFDTDLKNGERVRLSQQQQLQQRQMQMQSPNSMVGNITNMNSNMNEEEAINGREKDMLQYPGTINNRNSPNNMNISGANINLDEQMRLVANSLTPNVNVDIGNGNNINNNENNENKRPLTQNNMILNSTDMPSVEESGLMLLLDKFKEANERILMLERELARTKGIDNNDTNNNINNNEAKPNNISLGKVQVELVDSKQLPDSQYQMRSPQINSVTPTIHPNYIGQESDGALTTPVIPNATSGVSPVQTSSPSSWRTGSHLLPEEEVIVLRKRLEERERDLILLSTEVNNTQRYSEQLLAEKTELQGRVNILEARYGGNDKEYAHLVKKNTKLKAKLHEMKQVLGSPSVLSKMLNLNFTTEQPKTTDNLVTLMGDNQLNITNNKNENNINCDIKANIQDTAASNNFNRDYLDDVNEQGMKYSLPFSRSKTENYSTKPAETNGIHSPEARSISAGPRNSNVINKSPSVELELNRAKIEQQKGRILALEADNAVLKQKLEAQMHSYTALNEQLSELRELLEKLTVNVATKKGELSDLVTGLRESWNIIEQKLSRSPVELNPMRTQEYSLNFKDTKKTIEDYLDKMQLNIDAFGAI